MEKLGSYKQCRVAQPSSGAISELCRSNNTIGRDNALWKQLLDFDCKAAPIQQ